MCVCVCICACVHMCVCTCSHIWKCLWKLSAMVGQKNSPCLLFQQPGDSFLSFRDLDSNKPKTCTFNTEKDYKTSHYEADLEIFLKNTLIITEQELSERWIERKTQKFLPGVLEGGMQLTALVLARHTILLAVKLLGNIFPLFLFCIWQDRVALEVP